MQRLPTGSLIDGNPVSRCQDDFIDTKREWCPVSLVAFAVPRPALRTPNTNQMDEHQQQMSFQDLNYGRQYPLLNSD